jgi:hypothetical protein
MITGNVIFRTFQMKYGSSTGTCFTIDVDGKQYFVTAKHVIQDLVDDNEIELFYQNRWARTKVKLIGHSVICDVSVFAINLHISAGPMSPTMEGIVYGQDLYFLGFPFGLISEIISLNWDFPIPLVKKGILSALFFDQLGKPFFIDGHNNPGFSGGPIVFISPKGPNEYRVAGIISGYRFDLEDTFLEGKPTSIQTKTNTGIIIAYSIDNALDLIRDNPNGTLIKI